jgi:hypothetical protein
MVKIEIGDQIAAIRRVISGDEAPIEHLQAVLATLLWTQKNKDKLKAFVQGGGSAAPSKAQEPAAPAKPAAPAESEGSAESPEYANSAELPEPSNVRQDGVERPRPPPLRSDAFDPPRFGVSAPLNKHAPLSGRPKVEFDRDVAMLMKNQTVREIVDLFPGARITEIRILPDRILQSIQSANEAASEADRRAREEVDLSREDGAIPSQNIDLDLVDGASDDLDP